MTPTLKTVYVRPDFAQSRIPTPPSLLGGRVVVVGALWSFVSEH